MAISITNLSKHFAAEIKGISLSQAVVDSDFADILRAFNEYSVLVFRDQSITDEQQISFSERFGPLETTVNSNPAGGGTVVTILSNVDENNQVIPPEDKRMIFNTGNQMWHTDSSFKRIPALMSLLSGREVPVVGGETEFATMRGAYESLTCARKRSIENLVCIHDFAYSRALIDPNLLRSQDKYEVPPVPQAMVRQNPTNGFKNLFLGAHASYIREMCLTKGRRLISELNRKIIHLDFVYSHKWRRNDLVVWDNRTVLHRGRPWERTQKRVMHRTTVVGSSTV
ncbi:MAG: hypothetical protein CMM58_10410 [Rhodospirillaceae bacterium]|nr:hypothetical protein [Rhodospirillaceae bacterium]|tara:strand:+ start:76 stop:927 length:852 start_codon:yes stop_codon:yes gene_type:complete